MQIAHQARCRFDGDEVLATVQPHAAMTTWEGNGEPATGLQRANLSTKIGAGEQTSKNIKMKSAPIKLLKTKSKINDIMSHPNEFMKTNDLSEMTINC